VVLTKRILRRKFMVTVGIFGGFGYIGGEVLLYRHFYHQAPFVKVYDLPREENAAWQYRPYPWVSSVAGTNYCFTGLDLDARLQRIVVFSVLDNLGKGGAQAGVENMNIMSGLDRTAGLSRRGLHP
jgi:N-acetyl-gamma-glutamyl-phosphate reductase